METMLWRKNTDCKSNKNCELAELSQLRKNIPAVTKYKTL